MLTNWVYILTSRCAQNVFEIPHGLRIFLNVLKRRKEHVEKYFGRDARLFPGQNDS
jgi:hypothetical protein